VCELSQYVVSNIAFISTGGFTLSFLKGLIAIMVPREAPMGMHSRMAFTMMPMKNDMTATTKETDGWAGHGWWVARVVAGNREKKVGGGGLEWKTERDY
jgi:hypothetical protein